jgi:hypothetical protein
VSSADVLRLQVLPRAVDIHAVGSNPAPPPPRAYCEAPLVKKKIDRFPEASIFFFGKSVDFCSRKITGTAS